ncbi:MAG: DNA polymerase Y family protein, partial [Alcaligenaceae bacterium]
MLWAALHPDLQQLPSEAAARTDALQGLANWCLQYTPRVAILEALLENPAVVMEVEQSVRLFGGKRVLVQRIRDAVPE